MQYLAYQHAGNAKVVGVLALAGSLARRVDQRNGLTDDGEVAHLAAAIPFFSASTAALMAWNICVYPVQRHRLPLSAWRMSSSFGSGFRSSSAFTVIMKPGVQYPHCAPPQSP